MKVLILNADVYLALSYMICGWLKTNLENAFQDYLYSDVGLVHSSSMSVRTQEEQYSFLCTGVNSICRGFFFVFCR